MPVARFNRRWTPCSFVQLPSAARLWYKFNWQIVKTIEPIQTSSPAEQGKSLKIPRVGFGLAVVFSAGKSVAATGNF
jgi:hypothetical protein